MPTPIDIRELPARLDELLALAASGCEVVLNDGIVPRARLTPITPRGPLIPGLHPGSMTMASDFDAPLGDDFWTGEA
jgi:antitoxin (DNA-binding transcriptional repressor) of toxin-antitoxin stability system